MAVKIFVMPVFTIDLHNNYQANNISLLTIFNSCKIVADKKILTIRGIKKDNILKLMQKTDFLFIAK